MCSDWLPSLTSSAASKSWQAHSRLRIHCSLPNATPYVIFKTHPQHPQLTAAMSDSTMQPPDASMEVTDDLDQTVEEEINRDATQADAMNLDGANDAEPTVNGVTDAAQAFEARIPAKKDATLREFLGKMDDYAPIVRLSPAQPLLCNAQLTPPTDSRRSHQLLPHPRRPAASASNVAASSPPPGARDPKVHRRHCRRRIPVLAHPLV